MINTTLKTLEDGKMLTIEIKVNGKLIHKVTAQNISQEHGFIYGKGKQVYEIKEPRLERKNLVAHFFEDKAIVLAIKLLKKLLKNENNKRNKRN